MSSNKSHTAWRVVRWAGGIVCFGPTLLYLLAGVVLLPHQLLLAAVHGVSASWIPVLYYLGMIALLVGLMRVSGYICKLHRSRAYVSVTLLLVLLGVVALFLGPVGAFALGRYEYIESSLFVLFVVLPFSGVLYLLVASREHWMPNMPMQATREDARA